MNNVTEQDIRVKRRLSRQQSTMRELTVFMVNTNLDTVTDGFAKLSTPNITSSPRGPF